MLQSVFKRIERIVFQQNNKIFEINKLYTSISDFTAFDVLDNIDFMEFFFFFLRHIFLAHIFLIGFFPPRHILHSSVRETV